MVVPHSVSLDIVASTCVTNVTSGEKKIKKKIKVSMNFFVEKVITFL